VNHNHPNCTIWYSISSFFLTWSDLSQVQQRISNLATTQQSSRGHCPAGWIPQSS